MKGQEVLVQTNCLEFGRLGVRGLRLPFEKLGHGRKDGAVGHELKSILGQGSGLFARVVERQCLMGQEVV